MRKKRIMVTGPRGCGKTSLVNFLNNDDRPLRKTQDTIYGAYTIDVPAAFVENAWMYKHLIALAQDAWCILVLVDESRCDQVYSHGFARAFNCPVIGVISKCDLKPENEAVCLRQLKSIGVKEPCFRISMKTHAGMDDLKAYLLQLNKEIGGYNEVYNRRSFT